MCYDDSSDTSSSEDEDIAFLDICEADASFPPKPPRQGRISLADISEIDCEQLSRCFKLNFTCAVAKYKRSCA